MLDYRRDIRPGEQKRGPKGVRVLALLRLEANAPRPARHAEPPRRRRVAQCRHVSHKNPCCAADAQLRFAHDLFARLEGEVVPLARRRRLRPHARISAGARDARPGEGAGPRRAGDAGPRGRLRRPAAAAIRARRWAVDRRRPAAGSTRRAPRWARRRGRRAVLASHGVDLSRPGPRRLRGRGRARDYGALRDERREHARPACATVYPAPCATEAAEAAPRRRLAAREQKRLRSRSAARSRPWPARRSRPSRPAARRPDLAPPSSGRAAAAAEAPPGPGACPARKRRRRGLRSARASYMAVRRADV